MAYVPDPAHKTELDALREQCKGISVGADQQVFVLQHIAASLHLIIKKPGHIEELRR